MLCLLTDVMTNDGTLGVSVGIGVLALLAVILVVVVCHISSRSMRLNTPSEM